MLRSIRPRQVFERVDNDVRLALIPMPYGVALSGTLTAIEKLVMVALLDLVKPHNILEIGTYMGVTTEILALNSTARVFTLDLPSGTEEQRHDKPDDDYLRATNRAASPTYQVLKKHNVKLLFGDSKTFFFKQLPAMDFVFIDGGHDEDTVFSDGFNAEEILTKNGMIVFHDYTTCEGVKKAIDVNFPWAIHVEDTSFAFCDRGKRFNDVRL